jgi:hypothetical protein
MGERVAQICEGMLNQINAVIAKINAKLLTLNLGIDVWLELNDTGLQFAAENESSPAMKYRLRDSLGYAQCGKDWMWQLAIKQEETRYQYNQEQQEEAVCQPHITPLLSASRALRIEAMQNMDSLLALLKQRSEHIIKSINEAESAADRL